MSLRARGRSPATTQSYLNLGQSHPSGVVRHIGSVRRSTTARRGLPDWSARSAGFPATVANLYRSLQQLFAWLVEDGEVAVSPMARVKPPAVPEQPVPVLDDRDLAELSPDVSRQLILKPPRHRASATAHRHRHAGGRALRVERGGH